MDDDVQTSGGLCNLSKNRTNALGGADIPANRMRIGAERAQGSHGGFGRHVIAEIIQENIDARFNKPLSDGESYAFCASGNQDRQLLAPFVATAEMVRIEREDAV
jgi:hypothetical protein